TETAPGEKCGYCKGTGDTALASRTARNLGKPVPQTRRRFGGRQPCCDIAGDDPRTPSRGPTGAAGASDAAALRRAAAVVRGRGDVLDGADLEARGLQGADRGLTTGARPLDEHVDLAHAVLLGAAGGRLGGHLRGERRGLPGALEADVAGGGPGDHVAGRVGDRHDRVVERALDVRVAVSDVLLFLAAHLLGSALTSLGGHLLTPTGGGRSYSEDRGQASAADYFLPGFFLPAMARRGPLRVRALVLVR